MSVNFKPPTGDAALRLRELFRSANYCLEGIEEVFDCSGVPRPNANNLEPMLERTRENTLLNCLVRLFVVGVEVPKQDLELVAGRENTQLMDEVGMIVAKGDAWRPQMMLSPFHDLLIASDSHDRLYSGESFDYVLALNPSAKHLCDFTVKIPCESALDLCAGCGVHALAMSEFAKQVVTTDLNERAADFIQFSAGLNGQNNIRSVSGDGFSAVEGQRFDLIVCNPPFVMSPSKEFMYRDNDLDIDRFVQNLIQQAPDYLNEGGYFQVILEWVEVTGQSWQDRIREWLSDAPCDVFVLKANSLRPESYAERRIVEMHEGPGEYSGEIEEWIEYFRRFQVRGIHGGMITLRKSNSPGWFRFDNVAQDGESFGDYVHAAFASEDFLRGEASNAESLMDARLQLTDSVRLSQQSIAAEGCWQPLESVLTFASGWLAPVALDERIAQVVAQFDGTNSVAKLNEVFAGLVGVSPDETRSDFSEGVRELVQRGVLRPPA